MKLIAATTIAFLSLGATSGTFQEPPKTAPVQMKLAQDMKCYINREVRNGSVKTCYYDCLGSTRSITVNYQDSCPSTMQR